MMAVTLLMIPARAADLTDRLEEAVPEQAWEFLERGTDYSPDEFPAGMGQVLSGAKKRAYIIFLDRAKDTASILAAVILCGAARGLVRDKNGALVLSLTGALSITALSAGSLDDLIGLGWKTIGDLDVFSNALLPVLAAATAASGAVTGAAFQHVAAVFLARIFISLVNGFFMPLIYLYIGLLTASCALPEDWLSVLANGLKRAITGILTAMLLLFTLYLSVFRIIAGTADGAAVKAARAAISHVVPVVGGIIADASEAVLAGAGLLKGTIGAFGTLVILAACIYPFLRLGAQYLLYKITAFFASAVGMPELCRLLDGLSGAFGLVLGLTGSCALLLLISILSFVSAAVP